MNHTLIYRRFEVAWRSVEIGPSVSDDLCEFIWCCGGYHSKDIRKRNTPNVMNAARIVNIKKGSPFGTPLFISRFLLVNRQVVKYPHLDHHHYRDPH